VSDYPILAVIETSPSGWGVRSRSRTGANRAGSKPCPSSAALGPPVQLLRPRAGPAHPPSGRPGRPRVTRKKQRELGREERPVNGARIVWREAAFEGLHKTSPEAKQNQRLAEATVGIALIGTEGLRAAAAMDPRPCQRSFRPLPRLVLDGALTRG